LKGKLLVYLFKHPENEKMKAAITFILAFSFTGIGAQHCFTLYEDELKSYTGFNTITFLEETPSGDILFGGKSSLGGGLGLAYFNGNNVFNYKVANSDLPNNIVQCAALSGDSTWVGTAGGLAGFVNPSLTGWKVYTTADGLPSNDITALIVLGDGTKWIGFQNGKVASIINGTVKTYNVATTAVNGFAVAPNGRLFAAINYNVNGNDGMFYFNDDGWTAVGNDMLYNIKDLEADHDGYIWGNSNDLLFKLNGETLEIIESIHVNSIDRNLVFYNIEIAGDGKLWLTTNSGLFSYKDGIFQLIGHTISPLPANLSKPLLLSSLEEIWFCYQFTQSVDYGALGKLVITPNEYVASPSGIVELCKGSTLGIDAGEGYNNYFWNERPGNRLLVADTAGNFTLAVDEGGNCFSYDTITVNLLTPFQDQVICVVTVDEEEVVIAWQRTNNKNIWYTNIYRESSQTDVYEKVDSIFIDDIQSCIDPVADPRVKSYKYRISVVDSCGNESEMSAPHRTLHLRANIAVNGGVNLAWTQYEGQPIKSYEIRRGPTQGTATDLITTVASSENSYFFDSPTTDAGNYYYLIEAILPFTCDPTAKKGRSGPFTRSLSNLKSLASGEPSLDLSDTTLVAGASTGRFVGKFDLKFNDEPLDQHITFVEVPGEPSDNSMFSIENDSLFTNAVFPNDPSIVYTIWVGTGYVVDDPVVIADWSFDLAVNRLVGKAQADLFSRSRLFPNPAGNMLNIELPVATSGFTLLQILDMSGRVVYAEEIDGNNLVRLQTDRFSPGVYTVRIDNNLKELFRSRFVVE
jgi:hypothetical protein